MALRLRRPVAVSAKPQCHFSAPSGTAGTLHASREQGGCGGQARDHRWAGNSSTAVRRTMTPDRKRRRAPLSGCASPSRARCRTTGPTSSPCGTARWRSISRATPRSPRRPAGRSPPCVGRRHRCRPISARPRQRPVRIGSPPARKRRGEGVSAARCGPSAGSSRPARTGALLVSPEDRDDPAGPTRPDPGDRRTAQRPPGGLAPTGGRRGQPCRARCVSPDTEPRLPGSVNHCGSPHRGRRSSSDNGPSSSSAWCSPLWAWSRSAAS